MPGQEPVVSASEFSIFALNDKTDLSVPGGFGLGIVDDVSDRWGVITDVHGKTVWFEFRVSPDLLPRSPPRR